MKNNILIRAVVVAAGFSSVQAQAAEYTFIVNPQSAEELGLEYSKMAAAISLFRTLKHGEAIKVNLNEEESVADLHTFDDLVIRIPLDTIMAAPNREWPEPGS